MLYGLLTMIIHVRQKWLGIPFEEVVKKLLGDDYTEDWYPEEEQEKDRRNMAIAAYKENHEAEKLLAML